MKYERDILETPDDGALFLTAAYERPGGRRPAPDEAGHRPALGRGRRPDRRSVRAHLGTVEVRQVLRKVNRQWVVEPKPKTKKGYRSVSVHPLVMEMVKRRAAAGTKFLFVAPRGNHWRYEDFYDWRWVKIRSFCRVAGPARAHHDARAAAPLLTLLAAEGLELAGLTHLAGHAQVATTMDVYVHNTTAHHEPVRRIVGGFLAAGIRAGEEQRAAGIIRAGEIRGRIHRSSRETAAGYGASTSDGRQQPLS